MGPDWVLALLVATGLALASTPLLRRLALATAFVDHPGAHKSHSSPTPYLGGVGLVLSVLVAVVLVAPLNRAAGAVLLGAAILGAIGLADDDRTVAPTTRFLAEVAAAGGAVALGLRIHATGIEVVDIIITLAWIVGVTNAFNLLDNMDGLAAGAAAAAAVGGLVLAVAGGQQAVAVLAAALAGACLGFLAYNRRPASIFMGDAGSMFLGFLVAILAIEVTSTLAPGESLLVAMMLLAVPLLDTTTVTLDRILHHRPVYLGGRDHLSHRLVAKGLSPGAAVSVLVVAQAAAALVAVLAGRQVVAVGWAVVAILAVLGTLTALSAGGDVYGDRPGHPLCKKGVVLAGAGLAAVLLALTLVSETPSQLAPRAAAAAAVTLVQERGTTPETRVVDHPDIPYQAGTGVLSRPAGPGSLAPLAVAGGLAAMAVALAVISRRRLGVAAAPELG